MAAKKLARKLAKMSEEERAIFLEKQRQEEEEAQKKKEEMLSRFLKDKLAKEENASKLNMVKLQNQWRAIMRKVKTEELSKDVEVMSQIFERIVDRKDAVICSLAKDLDEAEEQYQVALRSHLHKVDDLIDYQAKLIKNLEDGYREELNILQEEFDTERKRMIAIHETDMKEMKDVKYAMELRYNERETEATNNFQSMMDELKNKNLEDTHSLSAQRKATLDELWLEFQKETAQYKENTEERKLRFEALKKKDEESSHTIARQMRKLHKLHESITSLKHKMAANAKEYEEKTKAIKQDRETVLGHFRALKHEMNICRDAERASLTTLTLQSDAAIKELQQQYENGEKILKLAEVCRKLETEEEKVLPFYNSSLLPEEAEQAESAEAEHPIEPLTEVMHEYTALQNFWKRYNKVLLDKLSLDREKQLLEEENSKLKLLLKQYLNGISVSDEVLSQTNPLFVVNSKANSPRLSIAVGDPRIQRHKLSDNITVIEAAHVAKNII